jgi:hypothetical protein
MVYETEMLRKLGGFIEVMGDQDNGCTQFQKKLIQLDIESLGGTSIKGREGLIKKQYTGSAGDCTGHRNTLPLASGEVGWQAIFKPGDTGFLKRLNRLFPALAFRQMKQC